MSRGRPSNNPNPSERELDVMSALWSLGSGTVVEVRDRLEEMFEFEPAYTTVLTQLRALQAKGWVRAELEGRAHRYHPVVKREDARSDALSRITQRLYEGSRELLLTELVSDRRLSSKLLARLKRLLDERLRDKTP